MHVSIIILNDIYVVVTFVMLLKICKKKNLLEKPWQI